MTRLASSPVRRIATTLVVTAAVLLGATACVQSRGEQVASDILLESAEELESNFENTRNRSRDADYLVATFVPPLNVSGPGRSVVAEPLDWSGNSETETGAELVVRFTVAIEAQTNWWFTNLSYEAATVTQCFRYVVNSRGYLNTMDREPCGVGPSKPIPTPAPLPALPDDAEEILFAVMAETTASSAEEDVRERFPEEFIQIQVGSHEIGLVVAVGVPGERDCIIAIRHPDGSIDRGSFDPILLEPGEEGCTTTLVLTPPW